MTDKELILPCTCSALDHVMRASRWTYDDGRSEIDIEVILRPEPSIWKRLKTAIKFLFYGNTCRYGTTAEMVVSSEDWERLKSL